MSGNSGRPNYRAFIPIGVTFLGAGIVFLLTLNNWVGIGSIAVGIIFFVVGIVKYRGTA